MKAIFLCLFMACSCFASDDIRIKMDGFGRLEENEARRALEVAKVSLVKAISKIESWQGDGELVEVFYVPSMRSLPAEAVGPLEVKRSSKVGFKWSRDDRSLIAEMESVFPTIVSSSRTGSKYKIDEEMHLSCIRRPDGLFRIRPNRRFGEFAHGDFSAKDVQVLERLTLDDTENDRDTSYLFDPTVMFEFAGSRIDFQVETQISRLTSNMVSVARNQEGCLLLLADFGKEGNILQQAIVLDPRSDFLPSLGTLTKGKEVTEHCRWDYDRVNDIVIPIGFVKTLVDVKNRRNSLVREMRIPKPKLNLEIASAAFAVDRIAPESGTVVRDTVENRVKVIKNGVLVDAEGHGAISNRIWIFGAVFVAAIVTLFIYRQRTAGK